MWQGEHLQAGIPRRAVVDMSEVGLTTPSGNGILISPVLANTKHITSSARHMIVWIFAEQNTSDVKR